VEPYWGSRKGKSRVHQRQDSRSHKFRSSDRRVKGGGVESTCVSENRHIGIQILEFQFVDIASSDTSISRIPIVRGRKSVIDPCRDSGNRMVKGCDYRIREIANSDFSI
jgi:hypothetical protein